MTTKMQSVVHDLPEILVSGSIFSLPNAIEKHTLSIDTYDVHDGSEPVQEQPDNTDKPLIY